MDFWIESDASVQAKLLKEEMRKAKGVETRLSAALALALLQNPLPDSVLKGIRAVSSLPGQLGERILFGEACTLDHLVDSLVASGSGASILKLQTCLSLCSVPKFRSLAAGRKCIRKLASYCLCILEDAESSENMLHYASRLLVVSLNAFDQTQSWIRSLLDPEYLVLDDSLCVFMPDSRLPLTSSLYLLFSLIEINYVKKTQTNDHGLFGMIIRKAFALLKANTAFKLQKTLCSRILVKCLEITHKSGECDASSFGKSGIRYMDISAFLASRWDDIHRPADIFSGLTSLLVDLGLENDLLSLLERISWDRLFKLDMIRLLSSKIPLQDLIARFPDILQQATLAMKLPEGKKPASAVFVAVCVLSPPKNGNGIRLDWEGLVAQGLVDSSQHLRAAMSENVLPGVVHIPGAIKSVLSILQELPDSMYRVNGMLSILKSNRRQSDTSAFCSEDLSIIEMALHHRDISVREEALSCVCFSKKVSAPIPENLFPVLISFLENNIGSDFDFQDCVIGKLLPRMKYLLKNETQAPSIVAFLVSFVDLALRGIHASSSYPRVLACLNLLQLYHDMERLPGALPEKLRLEENRNAVDRLVFAVAFSKFPSLRKQAFDLLLRFRSPLTGHESNEKILFDLALKQVCHPKLAIDLRSCRYAICAHPSTNLGHFYCAYYCIKTP